MTTAEQVRKHLKFDNVNEPNLISYSLTDYANGPYSERTALTSWIIADN